MQKRYLILTLVSLSIIIGLLMVNQLALQARPPADAAATMRVANQLYEDGQFEQAIQAYQQLVDQGFADPALFYNLGNAYFKQGDFGRAILNYRRAEWLAPRDPDIKANLKLARAQTVDQFEPAASESLLSRAGHLTQSRITFNGLATAALVLWSVLALLLIIFSYSRRGSKLREGLQYALLVTALLLFVGLFALVGRMIVESRQPAGVIVAQEVNVASGPGEQYVTEFTLHSGAEISVLEQRGNWVRLTLPGGETQGWAPADSLALVIIQLH